MTMSSGTTCGARILLVLGLLETVVCWLHPIMTRCICPFTGVDFKIVCQFMRYVQQPVLIKSTTHE